MEFDLEKVKEYLMKLGSLMDILFEMGVWLLQDIRGRSLSRLFCMIL
jgi:hypothetical protein